MSVLSLYSSREGGRNQRIRDGWHQPLNRESRVAARLLRVWTQTTLPARPIPAPRLDFKLAYPLPMAHVAAGLVGRRLLYRNLIAANGWSSGSRPIRGH